MLIKYTGLLFRFLIKEPHEPGQIIHNNSQADYVWHRLGFFTSWTPSCSTTFFCFDLPTGLQDSIKAALCRSGTELQLTDPFAVHTVLVDEIVALYDQALWSLREQVRNLEKVWKAPMMLSSAVLMRCRTVHCRIIRSQTMKRCTSLLGIPSTLLKCFQWR